MFMEGDKINSFFFLLLPFFSNLGRHLMHGMLRRVKGFEQIRSQSAGPVFLRSV